MTIKTHGRMFTDNTVGITQLDLEDGTANQAIVTDGQGVLRFATVGAGGSVGSSVFIEDIRTGDGSTVTFTLSTAAPYEESLLVFIDGVAQPTDSFTLPTTTSITFSPAPGNGAAIRICHLGIASSVADCSITGAKICMGGDTTGDILFYNGTSYQRLVIGEALQILRTNAAVNAPEWVDPTTASLPATGPDGNVLTSTGSAWQSEPPLGGVGGELVSVQLFDANNSGTANAAYNIVGNGTWTRPSGVTRIEVWVVGGGGSNSSNSQSGATPACPGGGGGGCAYSVIDVTDITSATFQVGAGGPAWLIGATGNNAAGPSNFVIDGVTLLGGPGGSSTSSSATAGGTASGGNLLNEAGIGNIHGAGSDRGFNSLAPLKRLGLGSEPSASGGSNAGNAGGVFIKEYSDANASLVGEKLVSTQWFTGDPAEQNSLSGTWTRPANVTKIEIWVVGGGGNATLGANATGGGGGGTAYSILDVTNLATASWTVGGPSSNTTFINTVPDPDVTLTGFTGNSGNTNSPGGGGLATGGQKNVPGQNGGPVGAAYGGDSWFGGQKGQGAAGTTGSGTRLAHTGCIYIKEYTDASLVSGGSLVPAGVLNPYAGATAPAGWLLCFGQSVSRTTYSTLFTAIGTTYGTASGTTFNLPDMRGRAVAGQDDMGGTSADRVTTALADSLGGVFGTETVAHTHGVGGDPPPDGFQDGGTDQQVSTTTTSVIQPTIFLNYIIKT